MNMKHFLAYSLKALLPAFLLLLSVSFSTCAAGNMEDILPPVSCGAGWKLDGKPVLYDRDTLSDRINGEAELYFPYGFDRMAAARYTSEKNSGAGIDVEIYRMGSLLDAFGMYANYRQKEGRSLSIAAESNLSGTQLFFYQGRHFVRIQMTGTDSVEPDVIAECARSAASRLPGDRKRPYELSVLVRAEVVEGTERYLPQSLLGYDFLNRGIMADAVVNGTSLQIFLLLGATAESASAVFDRFRSQLDKRTLQTEGKNTVFLEGVDPLYGPVMILRKGDCLTGALRFSESKGIRALLESFCR
jgi:hypothetical protein